MLLVQSFQSGSLAAKAGEQGRCTVTLKRGLGQTIYFSDRPGRIVGTIPTDRFLSVLGFSPDNPPNAALLVEIAPRSATAEHWIAALIVDAARYDPGSRVSRPLPPEYRDQFQTGSAEALNRIFLEAMEQCPFLDFAINRGMLTHGSATPIEYLRGCAPLHH
jgi:hypothetical protein